MVEIDPTGLERQALSALLTGSVIPRPVAWVSTLAPDGTPNLAPHSYFNVVSNKPPIIYFITSRVRDAHDGIKDTLRNVRESNEFVVNIVHSSRMDQMVTTASRMPPDVDEFEFAGVPAAPSTTVAAPRVADAPVALECRVTMILQIGTGSMVFGEITNFVLGDGVLKDPNADVTNLTAGSLNAAAISPVARLGGDEYATLADVFDAPTPVWSDLLTSRDES